MTSFRLSKPMVFLLLPLLWLMQSPAVAQSLTGLTGGFNIPTADFQKDKTLIMGYSFLSKKYYENYVRAKKYDFSVGYATLTFLPFAEVSVRVTYPNGYNAEHENIIIGDRMISGRIRALKEHKYLPAIVVGLQGFYKTTGDKFLNTGGQGASYFNSSYVVMTKNFHPKMILDRVQISVGFGSDIVVANTYQYLGLFYGLNVSPKNMDFLELMVEYDADKWNAGARVTILKHVVILAGLEGMDAFSGGISYKFQLP